MSSCCRLYSVTSAASRWTKPGSSIILSMRLSIPTRRQLRTKVPRIIQKIALALSKRAFIRSTRMRCIRLGSGGVYRSRSFLSRTGWRVATGMPCALRVKPTPQSSSSGVPLLNSVPGPMGRQVYPSTPNSSRMRNRVSITLAFSTSLIASMVLPMGSPSVRCWPMPMIGRSLMPWMNSGTRSGSWMLNAVTMRSRPVIVASVHMLATVPLGDGGLLKNCSGHLCRTGG